MWCPLGFKHFEDRWLVLREDTCILSSSTIPVWAPKVMSNVCWMMTFRPCAGSQGDSDQISEAESFSANTAIKCIPELELYASLDQTLLRDTVLGFIAVPANSTLTSTFWQSFLFLPYVCIVHTSSTEVVFGECHEHSGLHLPTFQLACQLQFELKAGWRQSCFLCSLVLSLPLMQPDRELSQLKT